MAGPSHHKPRRKVKATDDDIPSPNLDRSIRKTGAGQKPTYPLTAFLWPARGSLSQWEVLPLILMVAFLFRWAAGLWGYSGFRNPPMHGDYEAQRHWMEITRHLPISQWYFHDLEWWGLDYPPLTAYHSCILGYVGSWINPAWFGLHTSRGLDDADLKVYMRATVVVSEYLIYIPAAVIFVRRFSALHGIHTWDAAVALVAILMQPATILIDHVHFQYNTVMLGLVLASMSSMMAGRLLWSCVFFVAALGFKQMALYYAPAVFAYLLGVCVFPRIRLVRLLGIAVVTLASFALLVLPLFIGAVYDRYRGIEARPELEGWPAPLPLIGALSYKLDPKAWWYPIIQQAAQMIHRVFPFARGLFEDKVANFWCALNIIVKLRNYDGALLQRLSLYATLAGISVPCLVVFLRPRRHLLPLAFASTAWAFFLFSFQVHEKSVLLPLLPMTLLLASRDGLTRSSRAWIGFANLLACWTLFPLLRRVELGVPYAVLTLLWAYLLGLPPTSWDAYEQMSETWSGLGTLVLHNGFYAVMLVWHVAEAVLTPPASLPDLWVVVNVGFGTVGFGICYLWCVGNLLVESGLLAGGLKGYYGKGMQGNGNGKAKVL